jgi:hypothetical protein
LENKSKYTKHFKAWKIDYRIHISPNVDLEVLNDVLNDVLNELINAIRKRTLARNGDKINLIITNPNLHHPISTSLKTINNNNASLIELGNQLTKILTSNEIPIPQPNT